MKITNWTNNCKTQAPGTWVSLDSGLIVKSPPLVGGRDDPVYLRDYQVEEPVDYIEDSEPQREQDTGDLIYT